MEFINNNWLNVYNLFIIINIIIIVVNIFISHTVDTIDNELNLKHLQNKLKKYVEEQGK